MAKYSGILFADFNNDGVFTPSTDVALAGFKIVLVRGATNIRSSPGPNLEKATCNKPQAWNLTGPNGEFSLTWRIGGFPKGTRALLAVDDARCTFVALIDSVSTQETLEAVALRKPSEIPVPTDLLPARASSSTAVDPESRSATMSSAIVLASTATIAEPAQPATTTPASPPPSPPSPETPPLPAAPPLPSSTTSASKTASSTSETLTSSSDSATTWTETSSSRHPASRRPLPHHLPHRPHLRPLRQRPRLLL